MSHLEDLIVEFYDWQGYFVRRNVKVGRLAHGGWEGELDIVAYHPDRKELLHVEPSIDSLPWEKRMAKATRKLDVGKKYIKEILPWVDRMTTLKQFCVFPTRPKNHANEIGATIISIDELMKEIRDAVRANGPAQKSAISEQYRLLRTIQLTVSWYYKPV